MRVLLVGSARQRERLRQALANTPVEIAGEAGTLAAARARRGEADALLVAGDMVADGRADADDDVVEALTAREMDVLRLLAEGLPNKAIAARLRISDQTVKFHVASIGGKLGAANRTETVRIAITRGLIDI